MQFINLVEYKEKTYTFLMNIQAVNSGMRVPGSDGSQIKALLGQFWSFLGKCKQKPFKKEGKHETFH